MTDNSKKVSELPIAANVATTDRVLVLRDPSGNASTRTANLSVLAANLSFRQFTPPSASSNGTPGTICYDSFYVYVCTATNTWKRAQLLTW